MLKPLPTTRYEIKHVTESKVPRDYHVILGEDWHHYSVPFTLIGKRYLSIALRIGFATEI